MVSTGFQRTEFSDLHLAKFLIFFFISIDTQNWKFCGLCSRNFTL